MKLSVIITLLMLSGSMVSCALKYRDTISCKTFLKHEENVSVIVRESGTIRVLYRDGSYVDVVDSCVVEYGKRTK